MGFDEGKARIVLGPSLNIVLKPLKLDDLEGRGGREGGILTALSVLPLDQCCI